MNDVATAGLPLARMGLESFAPYLMNRIMGRYNAALRAEMARLGLTTVQMRTLATLAVKDALLIRDLAIFAVVEQSTLSRALDRLEDDGLIARVTDQSDNRATRVSLTDKGHAAFDQLSPHMAQAHDQMFQNISADEHAAFVATLQKVLRNVRVHDI